MAGSVLVEERVVEEDPALRDRGMVRNQRDLPEIMRPLVDVDLGFQVFFPLVGVNVGDAPVLQGQADPLHRIAVQDEGF